MCRNIWTGSVFFGTSVVTGLHDHHCIWSVMQKLKNILGSRKKGAQEPHAAREHRYDSQGNAPSNLKGISLDSLTLPAGLTSSCTVPLFVPVTICIWSFRACATVCVLCFVSPCRELSPDARWVQEYGRRGHWHGLSKQSLAASAHWWTGIWISIHYFPHFHSHKRSAVGLRCYFSARPLLLNVRHGCGNANALPVFFQQDSYIQSRADTMQNIESTIVELGSIFQQLAHMVKEQEETVQR